MIWLKAADTTCGTIIVSPKYLLGQACCWNRIPPRIGLEKPVSAWYRLPPFITTANKCFTLCQPCWCQADCLALAATTAGQIKTACTLLYCRRPRNSKICFRFVNTAKSGILFIWRHFVFYCCQHLQSAHVSSPPCVNRELCWWILCFRFIMRAPSYLLPSLSFS